MTQSLTRKERKQLRKKKSQIGAENRKKKKRTEAKKTRYKATLINGTSCTVELKPSGNAVIVQHEEFSGYSIGMANLVVLRQAAMVQ